MKTCFLLLSIFLMGSSCASHQNDATPKPTASFDVPAVVAPHATVPVRNLSTNATDYLWTLSDGTTLTTEVPSYSYDRAGTFRLRLRATGAGGSDTTSKVILVKPNEPPAGVMNAVVGKYRGRLNHAFFSMSAYLPSYSRTRDTTLQLSALDSHTLILVTGTPSAEYKSDSQPWEGHAPTRKNYFFQYPYGVGNYTRIQVEQSGDSLYCNTFSGGIGSNDTYIFYGKKQP